MAIELGPVTIMESPAAASDKVAQRNKANAGNTTKTDKADQMDNADKTDKSEKSNKSTESSPNGFMALLAEFDVQVPASSSPLSVADAKLLAEKEVAKEVTENKVVDPTGGLVAGPPPVPVLPALDPSALLGQMQIGLAGQAVNPSLSAKLPVPNEPLTLGGIQEVPGSTLAKHMPKSSLAVVGDSQVEVTKSTDISQVGATNAKLASVADKQPLAQSLQATLSANMAVAQNTVSRGDQLVEGSAGLSPTATLGESFRQLVDIAKSDKPAEITTSISHSSTTDRTQAASSGGWDFSTSTASTVNAKAMPDSAGASASSSGFAAEAQGANQVSLWVSQNVQSAELKLDAQGADPVEVSISLSGGEAQVQFRSDVAETRDMLSRAVADLDRSLQREGLVLSGVSVGTSAQGQDKSSEPGENGATSRQFGPRARGNTPVNALSLSAVPRTLQGSVDLFV